MDWLQAQCASLRITDCGQLLREASRDAIQRDDVCTAQCGFLLQDDSPISSGQDSLDIVFTTTLPPSIPLDSRARNLPNTALVPPLPVLQLPPRRSQRTQQPNAFGGGFRQVSDLSRFLGWITHMCNYKSGTVTSCYHSYKGKAPTQDWKHTYKCQHSNTAESVNYDWVNVRLLLMQFVLQLYFPFHTNVIEFPSS